MGDPRELVLDYLIQCEKTNEYSGELLKAVLLKYGFLAVRDKAFLKRLAEGCVERKITLDYYIDLCSKTPVKKMKPLIRNLLRMGTYQIFYMDSVPDSAAINEAVKLAKKRGFSSLSGFVNGVLRSLSREKNKLLLPPADADRVKYLSVAYSCPDWLVSHFIENYGDKTEEILKGLLEIHPVSLRISDKISGADRTRLINSLTEKVETIKKSDYLDNIFFVSGLDGVDSLPGFGEGLITVQDVSSALSVYCAGIGADDTVIDICAAPGGKSLYAAEKAKKVIARDVSENKCDLIRENCERLHADNVDVQVFDATLFDESLEEKADVLIADLPCSGLGVIGKKRDIKYNMNPEAMKEIAALQKKILTSSYKYVKKGGILLYSTCTINPEENEETVRWIVDNLPFDLCDLSDCLPESLRAYPHECGIQLLPGFTVSDGFFFARLQRRK